MRKSAALTAVLALTVPTVFAAVDKSGGQPSVNPCDLRADACGGAAPKTEEELQGMSEPMVIFLDAEGNTLVRMPLSKFRKAEPDAKLPPGLESLR